ncbi:MAG: peptidase U32 family protein [Butyricicoccaceae bacterium]
MRAATLRGFSHEEMADAIAYCRARNVKSNITLNILVGDRELDDALEDAKFLYEAGADALIVQDLGLARLIHAHAPDFALHASTQMTIHTLDGARQARDIGFSASCSAANARAADRARSRARQASRPRCSSTAHCACAIRVGATCPPSSGSVRGNRGLCAQPCRLPYNGGYPLSLKDLMLAGHVAELADWGVSSLKIEGRMKRPEYAAIVTKVYADLLRELESRPPGSATSCAACFRATASPTATTPGKRATVCSAPRPTCR